MRTHEYKLRTQADTRVHVNPDREVFFDIFKHISIKSRPKHVPTPPENVRFSSKPIVQQNPSICMSKNILNWKIKAKLENEKSLKNLPIRSMHSLRYGHVACGSMRGTRSTS